MLNGELIIFYSGILFSFSTRFIIRCSSVRESKTVLDSGFQAMDPGFQVMGSGFLVSGIGIPDSNRWQDPGFLKLYIGGKMIIGKIQDGGQDSDHVC